MERLRRLERLLPLSGKRALPWSLELVCSAFGRTLKTECVPVEPETLSKMQLQSFQRGVHLVMTTHHARGNTGAYSNAGLLDTLRLQALGTKFKNEQSWM